MSDDIITRETLKDWVEQNGCAFEVLSGFNHTGQQLRAYNTRFPNHYAYLDLPLNDKPVPHFVVCKICDDLLIEHPDCVNHQKGLVDHLKSKYADKKRL